MIKIYSITLFPIAFLLLLSCSIDALKENLTIEGENGFNFRESKAEWDELKKQNGNSYTYTIREQSWTGSGSETTIEVNNGRVTARYYMAFEISEEDGTKTITDSYEETSKEDLGTHSFGAALRTMDDLYKTCLSEYLIVDADSNKVFFETNEEGIMTLCGFVPAGCHDDCYRGIGISDFSWN